MEISFTVPGPSVAKERPRSGKRGHIYTPTRTRNFESVVGFYASIAMKGFKLLEGPLMLSVVFTIKTPRKGRVHGEPHTSTPDLSNLLKAIEDGMNFIVYKDDATISKITCSKAYGPTPGAYVTVRTL